ncbi:hypothetical protein [Streptomyces alkaliphilus]|nr:hypothetical protein [Streptomyces alkaliphilus]
MRQAGDIARTPAEHDAAQSLRLLAKVANVMAWLSSVSERPTKQREETP